MEKEAKLQEENEIEQMICEEEMEEELERMPPQLQGKNWELKDTFPKYIMIALKRVITKSCDLVLLFFHYI